MRFVTYYYDIIYEYKQLTVSEFIIPPPGGENENIA